MTKFKKFSLNLFLIFFFAFYNFSILASEIEIINDKEGSGPVIVNHSKIAVHYRGTLENGTEFDSSFKRNIPFVFQIGTNQVIKGWEIGLMGMKVGGKRYMKIPSDLAYGDRGAAGIIPPNSDLFFEIEVISVQPPGYTSLNPKELIEMNKNDDLIIIDIRTKKEWKNTGIIKKSKKITAFDDQGNFQQNFLRDIQKFTNISSKIVFISSDGDISSILANGFVERLEYRNIFHLEGGINNWITKGFPLK